MQLEEDKNFPLIKLWWIRALRESDAGPGLGHGTGLGAISAPERGPRCATGSDRMRSAFTTANRLALVVCWLIPFDFALGCHT